MDMPEYERVEDEEEDYNLEDFFLNPILYPLEPLIDYSIKLLLKNDTHLLAGETQKAQVPYRSITTRPSKENYKG